MRVNIAAGIGGPIVECCRQTWDVESKRPIYIQHEKRNGFFRSTFSPDGARIAAGGWDGAVRLWDAASGEEIAVLHGHRSAVRSIEFANNGDSVLTASNDGTARIWSLSWANSLRGGDLVKRACAEKLVGTGQLTVVELEQPLLFGLPRNHAEDRTPCLRRGVRSIEYWTAIGIRWLGAIKIL